MVDILNEIEGHKLTIHKNIKKLPQAKIYILSAWICKFLLRLPNAVKILNKYIKITDDENTIIQKIINGNIHDYEKLFEEFSKIDVYDENFEELEQLEIIILAGIDSCIKGLNDPNMLVGSLVDIIINLFDYYEQFSEKPEYWNKLKKEEMEIQKKYTEELSREVFLTIETYHEKYNLVDFGKI